MKILIIRFSSIGDIVLTSPVVRCVKEQIQGCEVHYLIKSVYRSILAENPYIDKLHLFDGDLSAVINQLKKEHFDFVVDLHNNLRTRIVKMRLGVKSQSFYKLNLEKWLMTNFKWNKLGDNHIVSRYLDTVKSLGVKDDGKGLDYFISEKDTVEMSEHSCERDTFLAVTVGAKFKTKQLPTIKMVEILKEVQVPIVLLGGKEDALKSEEIAEGLPGKKVVNLTAKLSLGQSASVIKQANCVLAHDTGLMHIAAAFKKLIFSVWGNTIPAFGMGPTMPNPKNVIFENKELGCRPCSKIGYNACPKGHFKCMNDLDFLTIAEVINSNGD